MMVSCFCMGLLKIGQYYKVDMIFVVYFKDFCVIIFYLY